MANPITTEVRRQLRTQGTDFSGTDDELTLALGQLGRPEVFDDPEFRDEFSAVRDANAPSLAGEAGRALKAGTQGLASTGLGGLGLVTGSDYLKDKAKSFDDDAAANAPTIPTLEDIQPGEPSTLRKVMSRDALRYGIAKAGGVAPSIAESVATGLAGSAMGTAMAPGPGTLAGAAAGVLEKGLVKAAIRNLLRKGVAEEMLAKGAIAEASEAGIEAALKAGSWAVAQDVATEAAAVGAMRGGVAANAAGSFLLNSGDVASEGADTPTTLALGTLSALPDTILPAYVLHKLFPGVAKKAAVEAGKSWLARNATKIAELAGVPAEEFGQEYFQEAINVVARNVKDGKDPLTFDDADLRRLREAGIAGAAGGVLAAPGVAFMGGHAAEAAQGAPEAGVPTAPAVAPVAPGIAPSPATPPIGQTSPARRVARLTPEQQTARAAELAARPSLSADEQAEFDLLRATVGEPTAANAPAPAVAPIGTTAVAEGFDANAPQWLKDNIATLANAVKPEVANQIEELSAQRLTAKEIAARVGVDVDTVRAVRAKRGIPSMTNGAGMAQSNSPDFEAWLAQRNAAAPASQVSPALAEQLSAPTETAQPAPGSNILPTPTPAPVGAEQISGVKESLTTAPGMETGPATPNFATAPGDEIAVWEQAVRQHDRELDVAVFGEQGAKEYRAAQRVANSTMRAAGDPALKAADEKIAAMEAALSPEARDRLFGVKLPEGFVGVEDAQTLTRQALGVDHAADVRDLAVASSRLIQEALSQRAKGAPLEGRSAEMFQRVMRRAQEMGVSAKELVAEAFKHRASIEGNDVFELAGVTPDQLAQFLAPGETQAQAAVPAIARPTEQTALPAPGIPAATEPSPDLESRLREELNKPEPIAFGPVGSVDTRVFADLDSLAPTPTSEGGLTKTREAAVLLAPDGTVVMAGLTPRRRLASVAGGTQFGAGVQGMGTKAAGVHAIKEGGAGPALLHEVVQAGYQYLGKVRFSPETPVGTIFQRWANKEVFDASVAASQGKPAESPQLRAISAQADALESEQTEADPARALEISEQLGELRDQYRALGGEPRFGTEAATGEAPAAVEPAPTAPAQASRTQELQAVVARMSQWGAQVDLFTKELFQADLGTELNRRLDGLIARYQAADETGQAALQPQIERLQAQVAALGQTRGVTYSPTHIALGLDDLQNASVGSLTWLLHEVNHAILGRDPAMQGRVLRAVEATLGDLQGQLADRQARSGVREQATSDPEETIVSLLAQKLAAEGIPQSPSAARAAWQWVKDLYYRVAMAVQAGFGVTPSPSLALDWFENQVRRVVGGGYDYRFNNLFSKFAPEDTARQVTRFDARETTPGAITDYFDPLTETTRQPEVAPETAEAIGWNLRFGTEDASGNPGDELDIPFTEAKARIMGAATNEAQVLAQQLYGEAVAGKGENALTFEQWWAMAGRGQSPQDRLAALAEAVPGSETARVGGERMTDAMNQRAMLEAKVLLRGWLNAVTSADATTAEAIVRNERALTDRAKAINQLEGDLRNAAMHEATLGDRLKAMVKELAQGVRRGLDTAQKAGALAAAVREAEGLSEADPIPAEYQRVFQEVMHDQIRVFDYLRGIAQLDLNLADMTQREIIEAINHNAVGDAALTRLVEPRNRPLLVALVALAKRNAPQLDLIQLREADAARYLKLKGELDAIRSATPTTLAEMQRTQGESTKAATMADRLKRAYVENRAKLQRAQRSLQQAEERQDVLAKARAGLLAKTEELETSGAPAPSEWRPRAGETYLAMAQDKDGLWPATTRPLAFTDTGGSANPEQMLTDLASNRDYLKAKRDRAGSKTYQLVEQQTRQLEMLDARARVPEIKRAWFEKFLLPSGEMLADGGGAGAARVQTMMKRFQFILFENHAETEQAATAWQAQLKRATQAAGMKDANAFIEQVYEPAVYELNSQPGLDEGPALRAAVKVARGRLNTTPGETFDEQFKTLLRQTKAMNDRMLKVAEDNGTFVADSRLGGELRRAVDRGWLTLMRRMNAGTVSTVVRDMETAGWKIEFKDKEGRPLTETLDEGTANGHRVAGSTTFDALLTPAEDPQAEDARKAVLEDPAAFGQAISGFFTPGIVQRWLAPFINKPGEPLFSHAGEDISQLDVQHAWAESGGDVGRWIDRLGETVNLERDALMDEDGAEVHGGDLSVEAEWRTSMLRQVEGLFTMESRIAADANQTKGLFDATGRPPHMLMDARENELLPAEHVQHMTFDLVNTKNLLATLAFHGAFGRNGEAMSAAIGEIENRLRPRMQLFHDLAGGTEKARKASAEVRGLNYDDLKRAAKIWPSVQAGKSALKAQFGFGGPTSVLGDVRGALELLHFVAAQTTNNPKTGLLNLLQLSQRAIARRSLGATVWRDTAASGGEITRQFFGQVLQAFGLHLVRASEHAKAIGAVQGQGMATLPWTEVAGVAMGRRGEELPTAIKAMRTLSALQKRSRLGLGEVRDFPALQAVPFLNNTMQGMSLAAAISNGTAEANAVESLVGAAAKFYEANPDKLADPTHRLTAKDVGLHDKAWFADETSFNYFRRKMVEYGIGNLETLARTALDNQAQGQPIIGQDAVLKAAMMSGNELDLQGSINTNPAAFDTNPVLKFASPLLGWPLRQMNQVHAAMRGEDGRVSVRSAAQTLGILAAWSLPIGLAFTFIADQYDDKLLKKKSNLGSLSLDHDASTNAMAVLQRLSRAGNIYGLGADFAATALAGLDPTSGQRAFSLDSRILAFSQLRTIQDAISAYVNSGFNPTFASVERPLLQAMGGNGALHALDLLNGALGLDNQEARITRRTNAQQWLRAAGKEAGIEVRRSGGASTAPTELGTWTREMALAATMNDRLAFLDAYRRAVDVARKEGEANPEQHVLESWRSRDPRRVFAVKPTDLQMMRAMNLMSDNGKEAVRDALRLFDHYTDLIAPTKAEQREHQLMGQATRAGAPDLRRMMAAGGLTR